MNTKQFKKQHRAEGGWLSLKSWARYISGGTSAFSKHAIIWLDRKS